MRRNQHGAHSLGVEVVVGEVTVDRARSADVGASVGNMPAQMALDPWRMRVLQMVASILRLPTSAESNVEYSHAQALRRIIHALCLELDFAMMRQQPGSELPVDLPMHVRNVLTLASLGMKQREIAAQLSLSPKTVMSYLRDAASQLGVSGTENAVREAFRRRLLLFENADARFGLPDDILPLPVDDPPQRE